MQVHIQFTLRHLLTVMLIVGVACGLAVTCGVEWCPIVAGLVSAFWNARGHYEVIQQPPHRNRLTKLAWLILAGSMFLPVAEFFDAYLMGWEAAAHLAAVQPELTRAMFQPEQGEEAGEVALGWVCGSMLNLANLSILAAPLLLWFPDGRPGKILITTLAVGSVLVFAVSWDGGFLIGYYAWAASFVLMLAAWRIGWKTVTAMGLTCTLMLGQHFAG